MASATLEKLTDLRERAMRLGHASAYNHFDARIAEMRRPAALTNGSWPEVLDACRGTAWEAEGLERILREAKAQRDTEAAFAQVALDSGDLTDLDWLFAETEAREHMNERARAYEMRTGREFPDHLLWGDAA